MIFMLGMDKRWAGFYVSLSRRTFRICLGFVAFTVMRVPDYDVLDALLNKYTKELEDLVMDIDLLDEMDLH